METKVCTKCEKEYSATREFFHKGRGKFGLRSWCKKCCREWQQSKEGKELRKKASKKYYRNNKKKIIERFRKRREENKEFIRESYRRNTKKW